MVGQRLKANKNRKGKERKIRCNRCGYAKVKEKPNYLHENLLIIGYANKGSFRELPIGQTVRCTKSDGSIGLQQGKHFYHDGTYYYHRAPFATVTCLYKRTFEESTELRKVKVSKCGYAVIKEGKRWQHSNWLGIPFSQGLLKVDLTKFYVVDLKAKPTCTKWRVDSQFGPPAPIYGPPPPRVREYAHRHQRAADGRFGFDVEGHFYSPYANRYYVWFGKENADKVLTLLYKKPLQGPATDEDWEAVKSEFVKLIGENDPDLFVLR